MDSLEEPNQDRDESEWTDPPKNPFPHQTQSDLDTRNQRESPPEQNSYRQDTAENTPSQHQEKFHLQGDEDPRLQQMFDQHPAHQVAQYPYSGPQGPVANDMQESYEYNPIGQFDSSRDRVPNSQYETEPQPYGQYQDSAQQQGQYDGHYYVEANIAPIQAQPQAPQQHQYIGYMNQGPVQPSPRRGYQGSQERDMRQVPQGYNANNGYYQNDGFVPPQNESYPVQNEVYPNQQQHYDPGYSSNERGYNDDQYAYYNDANTVSYQLPQTYSAGTYQSTVASKPQAPNFLAMNKKYLKNPPKKSYRNMYGKKKEAENEPPFVPQGRRPIQTLNTPNKAKTPLKALPNQRPTNQSDQNEEPMTAEEFWRQRAANLEQRTAQKLSGVRNKNAVNLKKYPSESRVDDIRPHRVVPIQQSHAIAEPIKSEISRSLRDQPITQTVYTEDGQRVSVDINLKLISPPPVGGPTKPNFNSYHQGPPPPQQQHGYAGHSYSYQYPAPPEPHNTYGYGHGGPTNQFTYRAPVKHGQHHAPVHSGRPAWGQVKIITLSHSGIPQISHMSRNGFMTPQNSGNRNL